MKLTYTDIRNLYFKSIGKSGSNDPVLVDFLNLSLSQRYQMAFSLMKNYQTQGAKFATTTPTQQYYHYPVGVTQIETVMITIGSVQYPLSTIYSQHAWDVLNAIQIQPSAIPQFVFPRRYDFGVWPIPQSEYTITFNYYQRDRDLNIADYTTGTVDVVTNSTIISGAGTTFTPAMVGRWLEVTSPDSPGQGYWYLIGEFIDATNLRLQTSWEGPPGFNLNYRIGEVPLLPDEGHIILVDGVVADYYANITSDVAKATWFENKFWTGNGADGNRDLGNDKILGGLIGLHNKYSQRDDSNIVVRQPKTLPPAYLVFAQTIT